MTVCGPDHVGGRRTHPCGVGVVADEPWEKMKPLRLRFRSWSLRRSWLAPSRRRLARRLRMVGRFRHSRCSNEVSLPATTRQRVRGFYVFNLFNIVQRVTTATSVSISTTVSRALIYEPILS